MKGAGAALTHITHMGGRENGVQHLPLLLVMVPWYVGERKRGAPAIKYYTHLESTEDQVRKCGGSSLYRRYSDDELKAILSWELTRESQTTLRRCIDPE